MRYFSRGPSNKPSNSVCATCLYIGQYHLRESELYTLEHSFEKGEGHLGNSKVDVACFRLCG